MRGEAGTPETPLEPPLPPYAAHYGLAHKRPGLGALLRMTYRLAPDTSVAIALQVLSRPRPRTGMLERSASRSGWRRSRLPFESGMLSVSEHLGSGARPRILLVHGWGGNAMQMQDIANPLIEAGFCPTLVDLPAHGSSTGHTSSVAQFSRALFALQARYGRVHGVVAHSAGALASAHAATRGLAVDRLVLISPPDSPARMVQSVAHAFGLPASWARRLVERLGSYGGARLSEFELDRMAVQIALPTLIVHDACDRVAPVASSRRIAALFACGELLVTQGLGHQRLLSDPAVASRVLVHMARNCTSLSW